MKSSLTLSTTSRLFTKNTAPEKPSSQGLLEISCWKFSPICKRFCSSEPTFGLWLGLWPWTKRSRMQTMLARRSSKKQRSRKHQIVVVSTVQFLHPVWSGLGDGRWGFISKFGSCLSFSLLVSAHIAVLYFSGHGLDQKAITEIIKLGVTQRYIYFVCCSIY